MSEQLKVGDTIYRRDTGYRRAGWEPHEIIGETAQSWILYDTKVRRSDLTAAPNGYERRMRGGTRIQFWTKAVMDAAAADEQWLQSHVDELCRAMGFSRGYAHHNIPTLRKVHAFLVAEGIIKEKGAGE